MDTLVTFVMKLCKLRDDFDDDDGQLNLTAPSARSNPTARRRRNHLAKFHDKADEGVHTLDGTEYKGVTGGALHLVDTRKMRTLQIY